MNNSELRIQNPEPRQKKQEPGIQNSDNRHRKKLFSICTLCSVLCVLAYSTAFSAEGAEHIFTWKDWLWPIVNFAILAAGLVFLLAKFDVRSAFKKRTEMVEKSLKEAGEAKKFAKKALDKVKERLKNTDLEIDEILESAKKAGEKEKEAIIADGEKLKNKILEQTKTNIEFELQKAKEAIKSEAAIMALELAEKQIREKLGKKKQETLIDDYIKKLEVKS